MEKYLDVLMNIPLFEGIKRDDLNAVLNCLGAQSMNYRKGEIMLTAGDEIRSFGVILSGSVQVLQEDSSGRQTLLSSFGTGESFAEVLVCAGVKESPVTALAAEDVEVMLLDFNRILHVCSNACSHHTTLIQNMLRMLAQKNLVMNRKIRYLMLKGMRQKLAAYLLEQSRTAGADTFKIPYSRAELADFLNVDRSALSRELGRLRDEGLIAFKGDFFMLRDIATLESVI